MGEMPSSIATSILQALLVQNTKRQHTTNIAIRMALFQIPFTVFKKVFSP
jgi:hypothetical protein